MDDISTTIRIRAATLADYDGLCAVFAEVDAMHLVALPHRYRQPDGPVRSREYIASVLQDESQALLVAESAGQVVGLVHAALRDTPDVPIVVSRRFVAIDTLVVAEAHRRLGIGVALMEAAQQWAKAHGATEAELTVYEFNAGAIAFYERLGYDSLNRKMWKAL